MELENKEKVFSKADSFLAGGMLFIGFLYWSWSAPVGEQGVGMFAFTVLLSIIAGTYLKAKGYRQNKRSIICLVILIMSASVFLIFDSVAEKELNSIFIKLVFIYWIATVTNNTIENRLSGYVAIDIIHGMFVKGFTNLSFLPTIIIGGIKNQKNGRKFSKVLLGVLIILPLLVIVTTLLASADIIFASIIEKINVSIFKDFFKYLWYLFIGIPIALYFGALIWGNAEKTPENKGKEPVEKALKGVSVVPEITGASALVALNLVYLVFLISQVVYIVSALENSLPYGMSHAEYARRGFFELCAVGAINLVVIITAYLLIKKPFGRFIKIQSGLLSFFTMMLAVIGISKMGLYIEQYGLTHLRIYTSVFMALLFVIFGLILVRQFVEFNHGRIIIIGIIASFLGLCYSNVDGQIAKYNIKEYLNGNIELMDEELLDNLSDGAVPYLLEGYENAKTETDAEILYYAIEKGEDEYYFDNTFRTFNIQSYKAEKIRKSMEKAPWLE